MFPIADSNESASFLSSIITLPNPAIIQNHSARTGYKDTVAPGRPVPMAAGQSVIHCHVHVIPRYAGDIDHPRGGIRGVIPAKKDY